MTQCPGLMEIAAYRAQETDTLARTAIEKHLAACAECRSSLEEMDRNAQVFAERREPLWQKIDEQIASESPSASSRRSRPSARTVLKRVVPITAAFAVAAALALVLMPSGPTQQIDANEAPATIRYKGSLALNVFAQRGEHQFAVASNDELTAGDEIRFVVVTTEAGFLDVFSVDRNGTSTPFYPDANPEAQPSSWPINQAGRHELPGGVVLDSTLGTEYFIVAFAPNPLNRKKLQDEAAALVGRGATLQQLKNSLRRIEPTVEILPVAKVDSP